MKNKSRQRDAIIGFLKGTRSHPTATEVYDNISVEIPNISLGTVYRNLNDMVQSNDAACFKTEDGFIHYDGETLSHLHLICRKCGKIFDADLDISQFVELFKVTGFEIQSQEYKIYGICKNCKIIFQEDIKMKKYVCLVCGYTYEGEEAPAECPICHAPASKFEEQSGEMTWAAEHVIGAAKGVDERVIAGLKENFQGECTEVGMYLAMARAAHREGYPEIGLYWEKAAYEEAEHAAKFAELLGEVVSPSTKENLKVRVDAENGATKGKTELAKLAKELGYDAIHDTVHEMARDEARHGKAFAGLLARYFG